VREWKRFVRSIGPLREGAPTFDFLHVLLPHGPWLYFPTGARAAWSSRVAPGRTGETWWDEASPCRPTAPPAPAGIHGQAARRAPREARAGGALRAVTGGRDRRHGISFRGGDKRRAPTRRTTTSSRSCRSS
jgi:hypothetical protein